MKNFHRSLKIFPPRPRQPVSPAPAWGGFQAGGLLNCTKAGPRKPSGGGGSISGLRARPYALRPIRAKPPALSYRGGKTFICGRAGTPPDSAGRPHFAPLKCGADIGFTREGFDRAGRALGMVDGMEGRGGMGKMINVNAYYDQIFFE